MKLTTILLNEKNKYHVKNGNMQMLLEYFYMETFTNFWSTVYKPNILDHRYINIF